MSADRSAPPPPASAAQAPPPRVRVILDPRARFRAAAGQAIERVDAVEAALRRFSLPSEIVLLRGRGHAEELARAARADGVDVLAIAAGDAVLNEVVQTYVTYSESGEHARVAPGPAPDLAFLPLGRGDFSRTLGLSGALEEAVARLRYGRRREIDLGIATYRESGTTQEARRAFINVASFGLEGEAGRLRGQLALPPSIPDVAGRLLSMGRAMGSFRGAGIRLSVDGAPLHEGEMLNVAIANGRFFAGGLRIAPHADPADGCLDTVVLGEMRRRDLVALAPRLVQGAHLTADGVKFARGRRVEAEPLHAWARVPLEIDGEPVGELPLRATVLEKAVTFRV